MGTVKARRTVSPNTRVQCPKCGAEPDKPCWSPFPGVTFSAVPHTERVGGTGRDEELTVPPAVEDVENEIF